MSKIKKRRRAKDMSEELLKEAELVRQKIGCTPERIDNGSGQDMSNWKGRKK